jgi:hypothetical protein
LGTALAFRCDLYASTLVSAFDLRSVYLFRMESWKRTFVMITKSFSPDAGLGTTEKWYWGIFACAVNILLQCSYVLSVSEISAVAIPLLLGLYISLPNINKLKHVLVC